MDAPNSTLFSSRYSSRLAVNLTYE